MAQRRNGRGFAALPADELRRIAGMGGRASHESGNAHEWTSAEAREAGRRGGQASHHHERAAFHHENAAHHHQRAASYHASGNSKRANLHADSALEHEQRAGRHAEQAVRHGRAQGDAERDAGDEYRSDSAGRGMNEDEPVRQTSPAGEDDAVEPRRSSESANLDRRADEEYGSNDRAESSGTAREDS